MAMARFVRDAMQHRGVNAHLCEDVDPQSATVAAE
jgi:hypothetical protein